MIAELSDFLSQSHLGYFIYLLVCLLLFYYYYYYYFVLFRFGLYLTSRNNREGNTQHNTLCNNLSLVISTARFHWLSPMNHSLQVHVSCQVTHQVFIKYLLSLALVQVLGIGAEEKNFSPVIMNQTDKRQIDWEKRICFFILILHAWRLYRKEVNPPGLGQTWKFI